MGREIFNKDKPGLDAGSSPASAGDRELFHRACWVAVIKGSLWRARQYFAQTSRFHPQNALSAKPGHVDRRGVRAGLCA
jgi:hypothetical protein